MLFQLTQPMEKTIKVNTPLTFWQKKWDAFDINQKPSHFSSILLYLSQSLMTNEFEHFPQYYHGELSNLFHTWLWSWAEEGNKRLTNPWLSS